MTRAWGCVENGVDVKKWRETMENIVFHRKCVFTSLLHEHHSNVKVLHRLRKWEETYHNLWSNF